MTWTPLITVEQLDILSQDSQRKPVMFLKHSTRCSISSAALARLERQAEALEAVCQPVYLDLLAYRPISNALAERYQIQHESPQVLLISGGKVIWHGSHMEIQPSEILDACRDAASI